MGEFADRLAGVAFWALAFAAEYKPRGKTITPSVVMVFLRLVLVVTIQIGGAVFARCTSRALHVQSHGFAWCPRLCSLAALVLPKI